MKAYVQNKETQLYLGPKGKWVKEKPQAKTFIGSSEAVDYCLKNHIPQACIVLDFGGKQFDVKVEMR